MIHELCTDRAIKLHQYITENHLSEGAIAGPDPIGKLNWRVTRFVRNYLPFLPDKERFVYLQGQAYWIKNNLALYEKTQDSRFRDYAIQCADQIVAKQSPEGIWLHPPIRGRRGFISTVEGVWASLGLLAAFRATGNNVYLGAAQRWYDVQTQKIGFQQVADGLAPNYYAHSTIAVPNVATMLIWLTTELHDLTNEQRYLEYTEPMLRFVGHSQLENGELPYIYQTRPHFMCYQYNSYQFLDLASTYKLQPTAYLHEILRKLAAFLATGLLSDGSCRYNCFKVRPEVTYWGAALAEALLVADQLKLGDYAELSARGLQYVTNRQRADGGFGYSRYNYGFLQDNRSYPRYLAMILHHLLVPIR